MLRKASKLSHQNVHYPSGVGRFVASLDSFNNSTKGCRYSKLVQFFFSRGHPPAPRLRRSPCTSCLDFPFIVSAAGSTSLSASRNSERVSCVADTLLLTGHSGAFTSCRPWRTCVHYFERGSPFLRCLPSFRWPVGPESGTIRLDLSETLPENKK